MTIIILLLLLLPCTILSSEQRWTETAEEQWYKRYETYPEYCSTPSQLEQRSIPPLTKSPLLDDEDILTSLIHVTSIIRHGARTPTKQHDCWEGYWTSNETGIWNCNLTTFMAPPTKSIIWALENDFSLLSAVDEVMRMDEDEPMLLFDKRYDALQNPSQELRNELNGTCQVGQLILRGYAQEILNGQMLRRAYVKDSVDGNIQDNMVLFDLTSNDYSGLDNTKRPYEEPNLYYRADDDQRTLMSGQVLLRGLFRDEIVKHGTDFESSADPIVAVHTADKQRDILSTNNDLCPRLDDLYNEATESEEYVKLHVESDEIKLLNELMKEELGGTLSSHTKDCMMTTICTDKTLPKILDDYGKVSLEDNESQNKKYGTNIFDRLVKASFLPKTYIWRYNDAAYSKLAFGPLWVEILSNILPFLDKDLELLNNTVIKGTHPPPKLALFSGHDGTVLPLLATLGEDVWDGASWAPYASVLNIEIHQIKSTEVKIVQQYPSKKAFRLLLNGEVLTSRMNGCPPNSELCDISTLLERVLPFATNERDCFSKPKIDQCDLKSSLHSPEVITAIAIITIISGCIGGLITYVVMSRYLLWRPMRKCDPLPLSGDDNLVELHEEETVSNDELQQPSIPVGDLNTKSTSNYPYIT